MLAQIVFSHGVTIAAFDRHSTNVMVDALEDLCRGGADVSAKLCSDATHHEDHMTSIRIIVFICSFVAHQKISCAS